MPIAGALVMASGLLLDTACSCDPGPPTMESCSNPGTGWDGVTGITIFDPRFEYGFQGGSHLQFQIEALGTDLPECIAYEAVLAPTGGSSPVSGAGAVPASASAAGATRTRTIYLFNPPFDARASSTLTVRALGHTAVVELGSARDAGTDAGDGGMDTGELDAGELDAGELDADLDAGELDADLDAGELDADFDAGDLDAGEADAP